jgi:hypothetical protein
MVGLINICTYVGIRSRGNVVSIADTLRHGWSAVCTVARQNILLFSLTSRSALWSTKIPFHWEPGFFPAGKLAGARIEPLPQLLPSGNIPVFSLYAFMSLTGTLYFYVIISVVALKYRNPEDGSTTLLRHVGNYLPVNTTRHPRSLKSSTSTTVWTLNRLPVPLYEP